MTNPTIRAAPQMTNKFPINQRVRIRVGQNRNAHVLKDLVGCCGVIDKSFDRPHCPYHIAGINMHFYEDELEAVTYLVDGVQIPEIHKEKKAGVVTYVRPVVVYFDFAEIKQ